MIGVIHLHLIEDLKKFIVFRFLAVKFFRKKLIVLTDQEKNSHSKLIKKKYFFAYSKNLSFYFYGELHGGVGGD